MSDRRRELGPPAAAIGVMFLVNGVATGSWVARLPEVRQALDISDAALGLTLLGSGIGGTVMSLMSGRIVDRFGSRPTLVVTSVALSLLISAVALAPSAPLLFAALLALGAVDGLTDVAQNTQALEVQARIARSIFTRMHAAWSVGALLGGVVASGAASADVSLTVHLVSIGLLLALTTLVGSRWLLPSGRQTREEASAARASLSTSRIVLLFAVGVVAILVEVPPMEWSSLIMAERFDLSVGDASLGFVAYVVGMVLGRLGGDVVVDRIGAEAARRTGALLAAVGIAVVAQSQSTLVGLLGLLVVGAGASALFPLTIRRASELSAGSSVGVAAFSSGTRAGMLAGSPLMGLLSEASTRTIALVVIAGSAAVVSTVLRLPSAGVTVSRS